MFYRNIELLQKIHHQELLREAEKARLVQLAVVSREDTGVKPSTVMFVWRSAAWIGDRMIEAGHHLKGTPIPDCPGRPAVNY